LPEKGSNGDIILMPNQANSTKLTLSSRFQIMFRLGEMYLVDMIGRVIDYRVFKKTL